MARLRSRQKATPESTSQWYQRASAASHSFKVLESHHRALWVDDASSDALECARWITDNPCPDPSMGRHLEAMRRVRGDARRNRGRSCGAPLGH